MVRYHGIDWWCCAIITWGKLLARRRLRLEIGNSWVVATTTLPFRALRDSSFHTKKMAPHQANTMTAADWIPVTWMPHTAVVPTSHVQFSVVSPPLLDSLSLFRVRVTVHGMAGQPLTPVSATTSTSSPANTSKHGAGSTQGSSHLRLPLRWRDLPRDAYLHCLLLGPSDEVVRTIEGILRTILDCRMHAN